MLLVSKDPSRPGAGTSSFRRWHPSARAGGAPARGPARRDAPAQRLPRPRDLAPRGAVPRQPTIRFHELPKIGREQIILPEGVLERVEAQSIVFGRHAGPAPRRRAASSPRPAAARPAGNRQDADRDVPRRALEERTTILLTGAGLGLIEQSVAFARILSPRSSCSRTSTWSPRIAPADGRLQRDPLRAAQPDGWAGRGRRRHLPAHDEPARPARARAGLAPGPRRPGDRDPAAGRVVPPPAVRPLRRRPPARRRRLRPRRRAHARRERRVHPRASRKAALFAADESERRDRRPRLRTSTTRCTSS